ncbi:sensor histidine kinase [Herbiconiux sp. L3-i23]|uniref:sensor histidine kinase n=1 Tax=Herbiconiux sp. L3-i23 TaxID=2905871 RepID=UPI002056F84F|nr:ATP-binding protein [Herbiconiux sp. L3-i23]BDI21516.1 hypothetical protein L3i23_02920 [Herbiconiux sp. L3-i23]
MSLGLPGHLATDVVSSGIGRGARVVGGVALAVAVAVYLVLCAQFFIPGTLVVPVVIGALALVLTVLDRRGGLSVAIIYLLSGASGLVVIATALAGLPSELAPASRYLITVVWIALVMVGGTGGRSGRGIVLSVAGYVAGLAGVLAGAALTGTAPPLDPTVALSAALVVIIYAMTGRSARTARQAQPRIHRAARDEKLAEVRSDVEARAAALLHDTVLGSLAAVATSRTGELSQRLRTVIEADLDAIVGQDWSEQPERRGGHDEAGPIGVEIGQAVSQGLAIEVTGDLGQLRRLDPAVAETVGLALRQLLVNVRLHSGAPGAEVVVFGEDGTVSVMVIDAGRGFDPDAVAGDRLGLRNSVFRRLEMVGGTVKIWSAPGRGTSVLLTVASPSTASSSASSSESTSSASTELERVVEESR